MGIDSALTMKLLAVALYAGYLEDLDVLLPSFAVGFMVAILVSLSDKKGQARLEGVAEELKG
jgi:hypothetical protein